MAVWLDAKPNQSRLIDSDWVETSAEDAPVPLKQLLGGLSYSASYLQAATNAAAGVGVATSAFAFTCKATEIAEKPDIGRQPDGSIFLGLFPYHPKARAYGATARSVSRLRKKLQTVVFHITEGVVSDEAVRLITQRCGLASDDKTRSLLATRPTTLPPVAMGEAGGLRHIFANGGVTFEETLAEEEGPRRALVDAVDAGMQETDLGEALSVTQAFRNALGELDSATTELGTKSRFRFAPGAAEALRHHRDLLSTEPGEVLKRVVDRNSWARYSNLRVPVLTVDDLMFIQSMGKERLVAAVGPLGRFTE